MCCYLTKNPFRKDVCITFMERNFLVYFMSLLVNLRKMYASGKKKLFSHDGFQVSVVGEPLGALGTLVVDIKWPFEVTNGKWLLYLTEIVTDGTSESHCVPPGEIVNQLNLTVSTHEGHSKQLTFYKMQSPDEHFFYNRPYYILDHIYKNSLGHFSVSLIKLTFLCDQMSKKSSKRHKRDSDNGLPLTEAAKTLLTPRKETYLLVHSYIHTELLNH